MSVVPSSASARLDERSATVGSDHSTTGYGKRWLSVNESFAGSSWNSSAPRRRALVAWIAPAPAGQHRDSREARRTREGRSHPDPRSSNQAVAIELRLPGRLSSTHKVNACRAPTISNAAIQGERACCLERGLRPRRASATATLRRRRKPEAYPPTAPLHDRAWKVCVPTEVGADAVPRWLSPRMSATSLASTRSSVFTSGDIPEVCRM